MAQTQQKRWFQTYEKQNKDMMFYFAKHDLFGGTNLLEIAMIMLQNLPFAP